MFVIEVVEPPKKPPRRVPRVTKPPKPPEPARVVRLTGTKLNRGSVTRHVRGSHFFRRETAQRIMADVAVRHDPDLRVVECACEPAALKRVE
jgi:hypothetical protein